MTCQSMLLLVTFAGRTCIKSTRKICTLNLITEKPRKWVTKSYTLVITKYFTLTLTIFEETAITAIRSYLPKEHSTADFLQLFHFWWLIVISTERFHPNPIGNAPKTNDSRCDFLRRICLWLENWRDNKTLGLSRQTFVPLIKINRAFADLSNTLLSKGYEYVLTVRFQTEPLERRFSQYRQMNGRSFCVSLNEVMRSELSR